MAGVAGISFLQRLHSSWQEVSATPSQSPDTLFLETFDTTDLSRWTITDDPQPRSGPSDWRVVNGELWQFSNIWSYDPPAEFIYHLGTHITAGDDSWSDYTLNAVLRSTDNDGIGLIVRYQSPGNYYRVLLMNDAGNSASARSPIQRIQRFVNGEPVTLHQNIVDRAYPAGYFSLSVDVRGDTIRAYMNGELIGQAIDDTYATGRIGLLSYANAGSVFDDILVTNTFTLYAEPDRGVVYPVTHNRKPYVQQVSTQDAWISWQSLQEAVGRVEIGTEKDAYDREFSTQQLGQFHRIHIDGLQSDTRYYYRVYSGETVVSDGYSFKTAPEPGQRDAYAFMVLGDSGTGNDNQRAVRDQMLRTYGTHHPEFLIHVGDVHQGNGAAYDEVYFQIYEDLIQQMPFFLAIGNHDTYTDNGAPFLNDFVTPKTFHPDGRYYAHQWGDVYLINLDTNIPFARGSDQYNFLVEALRSPQREQSGWTVLYFHHPPYSEYWPAWEGSQTVRRDLMPLFEQYGVDVVFNGHTHSYEYGELNGVHYVVTGGGGGNLDPFGRDFAHVSFSDAVFHFGLVKIRGNRLDFEAIDMQGDVVHTFSIQKNTTALPRGDADLPVKPQLHQNTPNPFNPSTSISFQLPESSWVDLQVFTTTGQQVATLWSGDMTSGLQTLSFDATGLASGIYVYRLTTDFGILSRTMMLMR